MKWSLPSTVCRISVVSIFLGPWLKIEAMALSMYARTVIWMVSFERRTPCMLPSMTLNSLISADKTDCHGMYLKPLGILCGETSQ
jgi:hypothetical protein